MKRLIGILSFAALLIISAVGCRDLDKEGGYLLNYQIEGDKANPPSNNPRDPSVYPIAAPPPQPMPSQIPNPDDELVPTPPPGPLN